MTNFAGGGSQHARFGFCNVNSLTSNPAKIDEISQVMQDNHFLTFGIAESKLNNTVLDSAIEIPGCKIFRKDFRRNSRGLVLYVKNQCVAKRRLDLELTNEDVLWVEVIVDRRKYLVATMYRPPNQNVNKKMCTLIVFMINFL
jgi:hypothetical protein